MVRCRQRCTNDFPVPHGRTSCSGKFEGDSCTVSCNRDYILRGPSRIYCRGGVWTKDNGQPAAAHCASIGVYCFSCFEWHNIKLSTASTLIMFYCRCSKHTVSFYRSERSVYFTLLPFVSSFPFVSQVTYCTDQTNDGNKMFIVWIMLCSPALLVRSRNGPFRWYW